MSLRLASGDYVIAGSGPLLAHGLRQTVGDLDIVARGDAWKAATKLSAPVRAPSGHGSMVVLFGGDLEVFDSWLPGTVGADALIDGAEWIEELPFCPLDVVLEWKERSSRVKDREDALLIRKYLGGDGAYPL
ncbi:hypothetical protein OG599_13475 [Streptomyces sp. NBC_01335]|uniref:hypothetical protein n=1 Tax=Streptomyces sp. NBC_01335 TaxID=2903828 RepID=UPI002E11C37C|nr:hypothetical protein OG599_13475 [Streptomyces sp. NBC_01335]